jgi:hypothetical protein
VLKLFQPHEAVGIEFTGARTTARFVDFVELQPNASANSGGARLISLTPRTLHGLLNTGGCTFVLFYDVASSQKKQLRI